MASPRALSPTVHVLSTSPRKLTVPSPRSPTLTRPSSPLSPRNDAFRPIDKMDFSGPAPPRPSPMQSQLSQQLGRSTQQRRRFEGRVESNLKLPALPRFHPAKYPSACSSLSGSPRSDQNIPSGPVSPGLQQRVYTEAQRNRYQYQREVLHGFVGCDVIVDPGSVRLAPLGSPGLPMTPLMLDESVDEYIGPSPKTAQSATSEPNSAQESKQRP